MSAPRKRFTPFTLDNAWNIDFPTDAGGVLRLGPGRLRIDARFWGHSQGKGHSSYVSMHCQLRIADAHGGQWLAITAFHFGALLDSLIDLSRKERARWFRNAPSGWSEALKTRSLLRGLVADYNDHFSREVWIDNCGFLLQFKDFMIRYDLAALSPDRLVVRLSELVCSWNPLAVASPEGAPAPLPPSRPTPSREEKREEEKRQEKRGERGDYDPASPLGYTIEAGRLLFGDALSRPVFFRRARGKGAPQSAVTFLPECRPRPSAHAEAGDESGFVKMLWTAAGREFLTDSGGRLVVDFFGWSVRARLDRHPNSTGQRMDVVRCRVRLVDENGRIWESLTLFTPDFFFEKLENLDRVSAPCFETFKSSPDIVPVDRGRTWLYGGAPPRLS